MSTPPDSPRAVLGHVQDLDGKTIQVCREYGALQLRDADGNLIARLDRDELARFALYVVMAGVTKQAIS